MQTSFGASKADSSEVMNIHATFCFNASGRTGNPGVTVSGFKHTTSPEYHPLFLHFSSGY